MNQMTVSRFGFVLLVVFVTITSAEKNPRVSVCIGSPKSIKESLVITQSPVCPLNGIDNSSDSLGVIEGDEASLQKALSMVHKNAQSYVVLLFYASWCPFSITFRPNSLLMASLYPSISHFAIEESVIRPSILSKYGVHGFPTLFVLNSTMRVRYHGSRTLGSLTAFYTNVTGLKPVSINETFLGETLHEHEKQNIIRPENILQQETYLTLATIFVVLRLFYFCYPFIMKRVRVSWRRRSLNMRFKSLWEHPLFHMNRAVQLFTSLTEPCRRSNLHAAMNAKAKATWASKSLASVSFGEASTSRDGV